MSMPANITPGQRHEEDDRLREAYLAGESLPKGTALRKGLVSLLRDPWLMVLRQMPGPLGFLLRRRYYRRRLGYMGKGVVIDPGVAFENPRNVYLDDLTYIGGPSRLVCPEGYIKIGKRCHVGGWILGHSGVEIGDYVASGAIILSITDSHKGGHRMCGPMVPTSHRHFVRGKVIVGKEAFLGQHSIIMPGVTIGEGALVGPSSLVVRNVKPWTVVMGSPAKVIGKRDPVRFPPLDQEPSAVSL